MSERMLSLGRLTVADVQWVLDALGDGHGPVNARAAVNRRDFHLLRDALVEQVVAVGVLVCPECGAVEGGDYWGRECCKVEAELPVRATATVRWYR